MAKRRQIYEKSCKNLYKWWNIYQTSCIIAEKVVSLHSNTGEIASVESLRVGELCSGMVPVRLLWVNNNSISWLFGTSWNLRNFNRLCNRWLYANYLGQLWKSNLEINPARMRYAEAQASLRRLYLNIITRGSGHFVTVTMYPDLFKWHVFSSGF